MKALKLILRSIFIYIPITTFYIIILGISMKYLHEYTNTPKAISQEEITKLELKQKELAKQRELDSLFLNNLLNKLKYSRPKGYYDI